MLEFLAAYYQLNCEYAQLLELRNSPAAAAPGTTERERLQAVERALVNRDRLEDYYAPCGVIVEPVVRDGFTRDLIFSFGEAQPGQRRGAERVSIEAILPINLPPDFVLDKLPVHVRVSRDGIPGPGAPGESESDSSAL